MKMKISDYEFNIGDEVITADGEKGKIVRICSCDKCKARGFYEPVYILDDDEEGYEHYITNVQAEWGFRYFYKIGRYRFGNLHKKYVLDEIKDYIHALNKLNNQLKVIEELGSED